MSNAKPFFFRYFPSLHDSDEFFQDVIDLSAAGRRIVSQLLLMCSFLFLYGLVIGAYQGLLRALTSGVKLPLLFVLALLICFPALYIVQYILGSRLRLCQMISIVLSGVILMSAMMVSFAPIVIIFLLTGSNHYFLQLLHIAIFLVSGLFGMITVVRALKFSCEKKNIYPHTGVVVFRFWAVILAFVGIQIGWNLRPFLGDRGQPFQLFRHYEGNFYTTLVYSIEKLVDPDDQKVDVVVERVPHSPQQVVRPDSAYLNDLLEDSAGGN